MSDAGTKRKNVKIGTHSGTFHCDEALGCFLLRRTEVRARGRPPCHPPRKSRTLGARSRIGRRRRRLRATPAHTHVHGAPQAFKDAQVVRSREPDVLNGCDIVIVRRRRRRRCPAAAPPPL